MPLFPRRSLAVSTIISSPGFKGRIRRILPSTPIRFGNTDESCASPAEEGRKTLTTRFSCSVSMSTKELETGTRLSCCSRATHSRWKGKRSRFKRNTASTVNGSRKSRIGFSGNIWATAGTGHPWGRHDFERSESDRGECEGGVFRTSSRHRCLIRQHTPQHRHRLACQDHPITDNSSTDDAAPSRCLVPDHLRLAQPLGPVRP